MKALIDINPTTSRDPQGEVLVEVSNPSDLDSVVSRVREIARKEGVFAMLHAFCLVPGFLEGEVKVKGVSYFFDGKDEQKLGDAAKEPKPTAEAVEGNPVGSAQGQAERPQIVESKRPTKPAKGKQHAKQARAQGKYVLSF